MLAQVRFSDSSPFVLVWILLLHSNYLLGFGFPSSGIYSFHIRSSVILLDYVYFKGGVQ